MRNQNTYTVLLIIFAMICLYNIQYTVRRIAAGDTLDPQSESFNTIVDNSLSLGLDLQGGMYVNLEIGVDDVMRALAGSSVDADFEKAIAMAKEELKTRDENFVDLLFESFKKAAPNKNLNAYFSTELTGLPYNATEEELKTKLKSEAESAVDRSLQVIRTRIDQFGVASPSIQKQENGRIIVELPGVENAERVRTLLKRTAQLEFYPVYTYQEAAVVITNINNAVKALLPDSVTTYSPDQTAEGTPASVDDNPLGLEDNDPLNLGTPTPDEPDEEVLASNEEVNSDSSEVDSNELADTGESSTTDLLGQDEETLDDEEALNQLTQQQRTDSFYTANPLLKFLRLPDIGARQQDLQFIAESPRVGYALPQDTDTINYFLAQPEIRAEIPDDMRLLWTVKSDQGEGDPYLTLIAIRPNVDNEAPLTGAAITNAEVDRDQSTREVQVTMYMNNEGRKIWASMTEDAFNAGQRSIAIVLDNQVYSYPSVNGAITQGVSSITGNFTLSEAEDLANVLKAGKLPAPARIVGENTVGPSLGAKTVNQGAMSFLAGFIAVILFMGFYYKRVGWIAVLALVVNLFFVVGIMSALNVVLTLPGIAGIVLSLGMAVDANVLIYERIREELAKGKLIKGAVQEGFRNAFSAIIDGNITTFLTGAILFSFGTGPIAGFAVTLMIGILTTLITALLVTRILLARVLSKQAAASAIQDNLASLKGFFQKPTYNIMQHRKTSYAVVGLVAVGALASMLTLGFKTGVDFDGGYQFEVRFDQSPNVSEVRTTLTSAFDDNTPDVRTLGQSNNLLITTSYKINEEGADDEVRAALLTALEPFGVNPTIGNNESGSSIVRSSKVGPTVARDIKEGAIRAIIVALVVIFLYIFARFRGWQFGFGSLASLTFNVVFVLGMFSLLGTLDILPFSLEIDQAFIAAILTIVGYTINDTVIVFDRIREALREDREKRSISSLFNQAINDTLSRTVVTSVTTLLTALILFFFGGETLKGFMLALILGILVGTLSSIFVASPIAFDLAKNAIERRRESEPFVAKAKRPSAAKATA